MAKQLIQIITISILLFIIASCSTLDTIHTVRENEWREAKAEVKEYLKTLAGVRFNGVVAERDLEPLFDNEASYEETALAARRAIRWRIEVARGTIESGSINLSMVLGSLLARKAWNDKNSGE